MRVFLLTVASISLGAAPAFAAPTFAPRGRKPTAKQIGVVLQRQFSQSMFKMSAHVTVSKLKNNYVGLNNKRNVAFFKASLVPDKGVFTPGYTKSALIPIGIKTGTAQRYAKKGSKTSTLLEYWNGNVIFGFAYLGKNGKITTKEINMKPKPPQMPPKMPVSTQ